MRAKEDGMIGLWGVWDIVNQRWVGATGKTEASAKYDAAQGGLNRWSQLRAVPLYQLFAEGDSSAGWRVKRYSKRVFRSAEEARTYAPTWVAMLAEVNEPGPLNGEDVKWSVVELELVETH